MSETKRLFWIKLPFDFYDRPEILYIQAQEHGYEIIAMFHRLIMQAAEKDGYLRFSESEPFTADTLSIVLRTPKNVVESALVLLSRFQLIDIFDNGTIRINDIEEYILSESIWAEKKRKQRSRTCEGQSGDNVGDNVLKVSETMSGTMSGQCPIDIDIDTDIDIDKTEDNNITSYVTPRARTRVYKEVVDYVSRKCPHIDPDGFWNYYEKRDWIVNGEDVHDWRALALEWERKMAIEENSAGLSSSDSVHLIAEYKRKFGESVPIEYLGKWKYVQLALATDTPLKVKVETS